MPRIPYADRRLRFGYAETSTRRHPREPQTIVLGDAEIAAARCVGEAVIDGRAGWLAFKMPGKARYYFQFHPW